MRIQDNRLGLTTSSRQTSNLRLQTRCYTVYNCRVCNADQEITQSSILECLSCRIDNIIQQPPHGFLWFGRCQSLFAESRCRLGVDNKSTIGKMMRGIKNIAKKTSLSVIILPSFSSSTVISHIQHFGRLISRYFRLHIIFSLSSSPIGIQTFNANSQT
jgi:hypothetical protein